LGGFPLSCRREFRYDTSVAAVLWFGHTLVHHTWPLTLYHV
jgi:hypothetical protein